MATYSAGYGTFSSVLSKVLKQIYPRCEHPLAKDNPMASKDDQHADLAQGWFVVVSYPLLLCTAANKDSLHGRRCPTRYQAWRRRRGHFQPRRPSTRRPTSYTRCITGMCPCSPRKNPHCNRWRHPVWCGCIQGDCPWGIDVLCWSGSYLGTGGIPIYPCIVVNPANG